MEVRADNFILKKENICGIVVWYNPTFKDVNNISSYINDIDYLYIFDNTVDPKININFFKNCENWKSKIKYISFNENKGIAFALNYIAEIALKKGYKWLLTMDQDSSFSNLSFKNYFSINKKLDNVAILGPNYDYKNKDLKVSTLLREVELIITSGNLINLEIWKKVNGFDEKLFIDEVDHEYCYKIKKKNYKILECGNIILNHNLGKSCEKIIFGKKIKYTEHSAIRKYYIFRNSLYITNLYPEYKKKYRKKLLKEIIKILLLEEQKYSKLKMIMIGIKDYKKKYFGIKK